MAEPSGPGKFARTWPDGGIERDPRSLSAILVLARHRAAVVWGLHVALCAANVGADGEIKSTRRNPELLDAS
jgi:hypothetical protein